MKLLIQIPCLNEEKTLPLVLKGIPKEINGVSKIEIQIIDDGSTDKTIEVAKKNGVHHVIKHISNKGLGHAFKAGSENALRLGFDILVNIDGDNEHKSTDIPKMIKPILDGKADIVIGNRQPDKIKHFTPTKRFFQLLGSKTTQFLTGVHIPDAVCGFRAYSRQSLLEINITSDYSYVLDTTIQAAKKKLKIEHVKITTNLPTRPSRLFKSIWGHIKKSAADIIRVYTMYEPFKVFLSIGTFFILLGTYPIVRSLYYLFTSGTGKLQSLIVGMMFIVIGVQFFGLGILADLMAKNRSLNEDIIRRLKRNHFGDDERTKISKIEENINSLDFIKAHKEKNQSNRQKKKLKTR